MRYLIVGAGLSGCVAAMKLHELDKEASIHIVERRAHIGGNCFSAEVDGIAVHAYGPHIFHTNDEKLWKWFTKLCPLVPYSHQVKAKAPDGKMYSLPFSMQTAYEMFGAKNSHEFEAIRDHEIDIWKDDHHTLDTQNAEGFAISRLGTTMYLQLVRGYTEKQWGCTPSKLPASIVGRLPVRSTYDTGYYADRYVGIPKDANGYMPLFEKVKKFATITTDGDWKWHYKVGYYDAIIYTGAVDEYFDYRHGKIEYRTSTWQYEEKPASETTGMAVLNYTDRSVPATRRIEYRYLQGECHSDKTHIAYERSEKYRGQKAGPMYVVPTAENMQRVQRYAIMSVDHYYEGETPVLFLGRLAQSKYLDMNTTIENAFEKVPKFFEKVSKKLH